MTPGTLPPGVVFTRASTATYFDSTGTLQTAATNAPRWDYNPVTHALNGLLIEEARTNVLLNSATLGTQNVTVTAVATTLSFYGTGTITLSGVSAAGPLTGTGSGRVSLTFTPTAGTLTLTVTGAVNNAQLESGVFATSWISTTAAAATRAQDSCTIPSANMSFFTPPGGSWMAEFISENPTPQTVSARVVSYPTAGNITPLFVDIGNKLGQYDGAAGLGTANTVTGNVVTKGATTWAVGAATICLNGGAVATSTTLSAGYAPLATGGVRFMANSTAGDGLSGWLRRTQYWPRALSDAEKQAVTR